MSGRAYGFGAAFCAGLLGAGVAAADTVTLNNGREIHGRLILEQADAIQMRTGSGNITIPKFKIATFTENENWGTAKPRSVRELREIEAAKQSAQGGSATPGSGGKTPAGPKATGGASKGGETAAKPGEWTWDSGVDEETREKLTPLRDELLKELEGLGKTKEERLAALKLSSEEVPDLKDKVRLLGWRRGRGGRGGTAGSAVYRDRARNAILTNYGVRATESLVQVLDSDNLWQSRTAATTLKEIVEKAKDPEDARWYMMHFNAPQALLALLDNEGDPTSPYVRADANAALEVLLKDSQKWPADVTTPFRSALETRALKKWRTDVARASISFSKSEKEKEARRKEIQEKLDLIRAGTDPNAPKDE